MPGAPVNRAQQRAIRQLAARRQLAAQMVQQRRGVQMSPMAVQQVQQQGAQQDRQRAQQAGTSLERMQRAAGQATGGAEEEDAGFRGIAGSVLGNKIVRGALAPLEILDIARRATIATGSAIAEKMPEPLEVLQPWLMAFDEDRGRADERSWLEQVKDPSFGYGDVGRELNTGNEFLDKWGNRTIGLAGDVAFDPMTYATFGSSAFIGSGGRAALAAKAAGKGFSEEAVNRLARIGQSALTKGESEALDLAPMALEFAGKRIPGTNKLARGVGRTGAAARGLLTDTAVGRGARRLGGSRSPALRAANERLATGKGPLSALGAADVYRYVNEQAGAEAATLGRFKSRTAKAARKHTGKVALTHAVEAAATDADAADIKKLTKDFYDYTVGQGVEALKERQNYVPHYNLPEFEEFLGRAPEAASLFVDAPGTGSGRLNPRVFQPNSDITVHGQKIHLDTASIDDITKKFQAAFPNELGGVKLIEDDPGVWIPKMLTDYARDVGRAKAENTLRVSGTGRSLFGKGAADVTEQVADKAATAERNKAVIGWGTQRAEGAKANRTMFAKRIEELADQSLGRVREDAEGTLQRAEGLGGLADQRIKGLDVAERELERQKGGVIAGQNVRIRRDEQRLAAVVEQIEQADGAIRELERRVAEEADPAAGIALAQAKARKVELERIASEGWSATQRKDVVAKRLKRADTAAAELEPRAFQVTPSGEAGIVTPRAAEQLAGKRTETFEQMVNAADTAQMRRDALQGQDEQFYSELASLAEGKPIRPRSVIQEEINRTGKDETRARNIRQTVIDASKGRPKKGSPYGDPERRAARRTLTPEELGSADTLNPVILEALPPKIRAQLEEATAAVDAAIAPWKKKAPRKGADVGDIQADEQRLAKEAVENAKERRAIEERIIALRQGATPEGPSPSSRAARAASDPSFFERRQLTKVLDQYRKALLKTVNPKEQQRIQGRIAAIERKIRDLDVPTGKGKIEVVRPAEVTTRTVLEDVDPKVATKRAEIEGRVGDLERELEQAGRDPTAVMQGQLDAWQKTLDNLDRQAATPDVIQRKDYLRNQIDDMREQIVVARAQPKTGARRGPRWRQQMEAKIELARGELERLPAQVERQIEEATPAQVRQGAREGTGTTQQVRAPRLNPENEEEIKHLMFRLERLAHYAPGEKSAPTPPSTMLGSPLNDVRVKPLIEHSERLHDFAVRYYRAVESGATPGDATAVMVLGDVLERERGKVAQEFETGQRAIGKFIPTDEVRTAEPAFTAQEVAARAESEWAKRQTQHAQAMENWKRMTARVKAEAKTLGTRRGRRTHVAPTALPPKPKPLGSKKAFIEAARGRLSQERVRPLTETERQATKAADNSLMQEFARVLEPMAQSVDVIRKRKNKLDNMVRNFKAGTHTISGEEIPGRVAQQDTGFFETLNRPVRGMQYKTPDVKTVIVRDAEGKEVRRYVPGQVTEGAPTPKARKAPGVGKEENIVLNELADLRMLPSGAIGGRPGINTSGVIGERNAAQRQAAEMLGIEESADVGKTVSSLAEEARRQVTQEEAEFANSMWEFTGFRWDKPQAAITTLKGRKSKLMWGNDEMTVDDLRKLVASETGIAEEEIAHLRSVPKLLGIWGHKLTGDESLLTDVNMNRLNKAVGLEGKKAGISWVPLKGKLSAADEVALLGQDMASDIERFVDTGRREFIAALYKKMEPKAREHLANHVRGRVRVKGRTLNELDARLGALDVAGGGAAVRGDWTEALAPMAVGDIPSMHGVRGNVSVPGQANVVGGLSGRARGRAATAQGETEDLSDWFQRGRYEQLAEERLDYDINKAKAEFAAPDPRAAYAEGREQLATLGERQAQLPEQRAARETDVAARQAAARSELAQLAGPIEAGRGARRQLYGTPLEAGAEGPTLSPLNVEEAAAQTLETFTGPTRERLGNVQANRAELAQQQGVLTERIRAMPEDMRREMDTFTSAQQAIHADQDKALEMAYEAEPIIKEARNQVAKAKGLERTKANTAAEYQTMLTELRTAIEVGAPPEAIALLSEAGRLTPELEAIDNQLIGFSQFKKDVASGKLPAITKDAIKAGYESFSSKTTGFSGVIDSQVQTALTNIDNVLLKKKSDFGRAIDAYTRFFKAYATATPGFQLRNGMSAAFMNASDGVSVPNMIGGTRIFTAYMRNPEGEWWKALPPRYRDVAQEVVDTVYKTGAGGAYTASEIGERAAGRTRGKVKRFLTENKWLRGSQIAGEWVEGGVRAGMVLDTLLGRGSVEEAMTRVNRVHFNYSQVSEFDEMARRMIPFWTFMSRNLPLQVQQLWTKPRTYLHYQSFKRNFSDPNEDQSDLPQWMRQRGGFRLTGGLALMPEMGANQLQTQLEALSSPSQLMAQTTPLLKVPAQLTTNRNFFYDEPYQENDYQKIQGEMNLAALPLGLLGQTENLPGGGLGAERKWQEAARDLIPQMALFNRLAGTSPQYEDKTQQAWLNLLGLPFKQTDAETLASEQRRRRGERKYGALDDQAKRQALAEAARG